MFPRFDFLDDEYNLKHVSFDVNHNLCIIMNSRVNKK